MGLSYNLLSQRQARPRVHFLPLCPCCGKEMNLHELCIQAQDKCDESKHFPTIHLVRNFTCGLEYRTLHPEKDYFIELEKAKRMLLQYICFDNLKPIDDVMFKNSKVKQ